MSPIDVTVGILKVIWLVEMALGIFAFVDALRHKPEAYVAAGKLTKPKWTAITGVGLLLILLADPFGWPVAPIYGALSFLTLAAVIACAVYLVDVRPALAQMRGRGGRGGHMGPYGPW